jgi:glutathione S-transferase
MYPRLAQRAHSNFTETHLSFLGGLLIAGLQYPTASAVLGATWVIGRISYAIGYVNRGPSGRILGFYPSVLADLVLRGLACYTSVMLVLGQ